jgi:hypothetical protein
VNKLFLVLVLFSVVSAQVYRVPGPNTAVLESNGATPINIQDQYSESIDLYMHNNIANITLLNNTAVDSDSAVFVGGHGILAGNLVCFRTSTRYTQVKALTVTVDTVWFDTPLDYTYTTTDSVHSAEHDMAVNGAVTPVIYHITPPSGVEWDVVRVMFHIEDGTAMDDGTFGGIAALTNGVVLRTKNGIYKNLFNVKTNGEFAERAYDREYVAKPPSGTGHAMNVRRTWGGQSKSGVVLRLDGAGADELQIIIKDDLTGLNHFHCIIQGHTVTD